MHAKSRRDWRCAACDITHGGLHLEETAGWKSVKAGLVGEGVDVQQMHLDEMGGEVSFAKFSFLGYLSG